MKIQWTNSMTKRALTYIVSGAGIILAYFLMKNFGEVKNLWDSVRDILRPFTVGIIFAYLLNGPLMFFERKFSFVEKTKPRRVLKRVLAIIAAWIATIAVLSAFFYIVMPDITKSINVLINNIPLYLSNLQALVGGIAETYKIEAPFIDNFLEFRISSEVFATILKEYGKDLLPQLANIANLSVQIGGAVFDIVIAIILS
ncbi:MAG: AI-2E family transporter, partial [Oscillospiraceae bacterium]|nr:AI-2E family transporter [Oscillospiraceae bacterium]